MCNIMTLEDCGAMIFQLLHAFVVCTGVCYITITEVPDGSPGLYFEKDNIIGFSAGDTRLNIGDRLHVGEVANIDECNAW